jgi:hypothetical protein
MCVLALGPVEAADFTVKADGSGTFATIQACANVARAGDTCTVYPGVYPEHVRTAAGGSGDTARVTFKAQGVVTTHGFDIRHPYVSVEGFDITGYGVKYTGSITIYFGGSFCRITGNTVRDGAVDVYGIHFLITSGQAANNCVVQRNRLSNLNGNFLSTAGDGHLFEGNTLEFQNNRDYIRLFGSNQVFRRNVFRQGTAQAGVGNHPDFAQTFGGQDLKSENHLFEENWIQDLASQFSQMNSGDGVVSKGVLHSNVKNVTFRRNVIISVSMNANTGMPGVRFENNTFYRMAYQLGGISYSGSLTRGDPSFGMLKNNVFLAGGSRSTTINDSSGFYSFGGHVISREVIGVFVTADPTGQGVTSNGIYDDLRNKGYIDPNGKILAKTTALTDVSQFTLDTQFASYKSAVYDVLVRTARMDQTARGSFVADYNFVAGAQSAGFPAKRSNGCISGETYTDWNFCEPHGLNGGDPRFANLANPLGPDGIPFTLDDGLKPLPTSPLCGKGQGGSDIGAYSCDPAQVFQPNGDRPAPPKNLRIVPFP